MTAIELLYDALPAGVALPETPHEGVCCVLGTTEPCLDRGYAIQDSFTNLDLLRAPASRSISVRAWRVLTHRVPAAEGKKRDTFPLMQSSWLCDSAGGVLFLTRTDVRQIVLDGVAYSSAPWCGYVTTSYKKHGCLRAPVNTGTSQRWLFETEIVDCSNRAQVAEWWTRLRETRVSGIPRPVIETLDISVPLLGKHLARWTAFEAWARPRMRSPLYRFLTYLLPSEEEIHHGQAEGEERR